MCRDIKYCESTFVMEMVDCFDFETETSSDSEKQTGRFLCHLSKLKKTEGTPALTGEQKYCLHVTQFVPTMFYKCHLGSKTQEKCRFRKCIGYI
ncbi:hypothetical protein JTB14_024578 [Gonioctena quinquepunctata]|nr:hypothetical protein JTB14_024578 [Gonioctena quinquepunctata]